MDAANGGTQHLCDCKSALMNHLSCTHGLQKRFAHALTLKRSVCYRHQFTRNPCQLSTNQQYLQSRRCAGNSTENQHTAKGTHVIHRMVKLDSLNKTVSNSCTKWSGQAPTFTNIVSDCGVDNAALTSCRLTHTLLKVEQAITHEHTS